MRWRHVDTVFLFSLLLLYFFAALIQPGTVIYEWVATTAQSWRSFAQNTPDVIPVTILVCLFGNTTLFIGVIPYPIILFELAKYYPQWWLLGIVGGIFAGFGEFSSYLIGYLFGNAKSPKLQEYHRRFDDIRVKMERHPRSVPFFVFLFAMTPLPDDAILIPCGVMKYPVWKGIIPCILGKTVLMTFISWLGYIVGQNADVLNDWIEMYPILIFLRLIVPTSTVNPAADIVQFSFVFWVLWAVTRMNPSRQLKQSIQTIDHFLAIQEIAAIHLQCPGMMEDSQFLDCLSRSDGDYAPSVFHACYYKHIYQKKCHLPYTLPK